MVEKRGEESDHPIPGPKDVDTHHPLERDPDDPLIGYLAKYQAKFREIFRMPGHWIRENIVEPNRGEKYYWYHRRYPRVLPIDECYNDDFACIYEANLEYRRNFAVDRAALNILRFRVDSCHFYHKNEQYINTLSDKCEELVKTYEDNLTNFHIKYGDLKTESNVIDAYMKQKHRMIMERRKALKEQQEKEN